MTEMSEIKATAFWARTLAGRTIRGKYYAPLLSLQGSSAPLLVVSHGFGACYADLEHHAPGFAEAGIGCLLFDFCGGSPRSTSDGTMEEMTVASEVADLERVLGEARTLPGVDGERIFLLGESQGGLVSAIVAAKHPELVRKLVLWYPAFVIPDDARKRLELPPERADDVFGMRISPDYNRVAADLDIEAIQASYAGPVLLIHGTADSVVPIRYSREAARRYTSARLLELGGAGHGFEHPDNVRAREETIHFLQEGTP